MDIRDRSNINNVNERLGFSEPSLFNFYSSTFLVDSSEFVYIQLTEDKILYINLIINMEEKNNIKKSNNSENDSLLDCFELIQDLESISTTYLILVPCSFDQDGREKGLYYTSIDDEKASIFLNEVLICGQIKRIADSNNHNLISKFYKAVQIAQSEVNKCRYPSKSLQNLITQIRDSFYQALPYDNITKIEIEKNIQIEQEKEKNKNMDNPYANIFEIHRIKRDLSDRVAMIFIITFGVLLCFLFGKIIFLIYSLIISFLLLPSLISQIKRFKDLKSKKK